MIALLQRVKFASVEVENREIAAIGVGLLVLLGVEKADDVPMLDRMAEKILKYRVFSDEDDKMNLSVMDINGSILIVPQFTLAADTDKGLRPSFSSAALPEKGFALYTQLVDIIRLKGESMNSALMNPVLNQGWLQTGQFGADMAVQLLNDGPVTFSLKV